MRQGDYPADTIGRLNLAPRGYMEFIRTEMDREEKSGIEVATASFRARLDTVVEVGGDRAQETGQE